jgi:hypothetical protein
MPRIGTGMIHHRMLSALVTIGVLLLAHATAATLQPSTMTDGQVRRAIIQDSISAYRATGHPCACPFNTARNGSACGGRSAYSRPGGAAPLCYPKDVTNGMVQDWRATHH